ncbi:hypothetical protein BpHYR1_046050 [Brachionus plicatilis]|uniref:Uncharacterized protein n=1 Tax=Brachionus plicatilis TaxID=10195 RepID=A0A3M7R0F4_BRAPC|nr:hypothetical protein BpHYR1_046050 [Brachionus plicatilis]
MSSQIYGDNNILIIKNIMSFLYSSINELAHAIEKERKKEKIVRQQLHSGVGYLRCLDSKPSLYSSTNLAKRFNTECVNNKLISFH